MRTQTDFYHTKWSNYEKPEWYHPYNGLDWRSEYLYTKRDDETSTALPPRVWMAFDFFCNYRPYIYIILFGLSQLYMAFRFWAEREVEKIEMQVL